MTNRLPHFYTPAEVAAALGISRTAVYRLLEQRQIEHHRLGDSGRAIRIPEHAIKDYLLRTRIGA